MTAISAATTDASGLAVQLEALSARLAELSTRPVAVAPLAQPSVDADPADLSVILTVIRTSIPPYVAGQAVSRLDAHVLVTAVGEHAAAADLIADAMLQTLAVGEWEVVAGEPSLELWNALGRPPQPAFVINVPVLRPINRWQAPLVRHRAEVRSGRVGDFAGATGVPRTPAPRI